MSFLYSVFQVYYVSNFLRKKWFTSGRTYFAWNRVQNELSMTHLFVLRSAEEHVGREKFRILAINLPRKALENWAITPWTSWTLKQRHPIWTRWKNIYQKHHKSQPFHLETSASGQIHLKSMKETVRSWPLSRSTLWTEISTTSSITIFKSHTIHPSKPSHLSICLICKHRCPVHTEEQLLVGTAVGRVADSKQGANQSTVGWTLDCPA